MDLRSQDAVFSAYVSDVYVRAYSVSLSSCYKLGTKWLLRTSEPTVTMDWLCVLALNVLRCFDEVASELGSLALWLRVDLLL